MPAALLPDFSVFDKPRFYIGGDEQAVISCAQQWLDFSDDCTRGASSLVGAQPYGFVGSEGEAFNQHVGQAVPSQLQVASGVGEQVYAGIRMYAAGLGEAKTKMDAQRFTGMGCHAAVNTAAEAVNAAEAHLALAISTGNAAAISVAQANLKMCEVTYTQAVAEWEACLTGADTIKAELLEVTTRAAGQVTSVVTDSSQGAIACVDPSGLSPYFQVVVWELETLAETADQVAELVASGMNQITSLVGADEISGDVITQAVDDTRLTWKYAAAQLMEDIERIGRQAIMFAQLYAEHDQYSTSLFDPITQMMRGMFASILDHPADKVKPGQYDASSIAAGLDSYADANNRSIFDPSLSQVVPMAQLVADMRMMRTGVVDDPKALRRNTTRKTNTEAYLMANGQLPLPDGVMSRMIRPPANGEVTVDAELLQSHVTPFGRVYRFDARGVPVAAGDRPNISIGFHPADGTLIMKHMSGSYEKIFPRPPHGTTMQPYQTYERWDPITNTTTQHITYSNGMVIESASPGKNPHAFTAIDSQRGVNVIQPQTPLAATWQTPFGNTLNVQDTPLSPVTTYQLPEPPTQPRPKIDVHEVSKYTNYPATAAGGAAKGITTVQEVDQFHTPESSDIPGAQYLDDARKVAKYLGPIGKAGDVINLVDGGLQTRETGSAVPVSEAAGSFGGGMLGGAASGAAVGFFGGGPLTAGIFGVVGAIAGSEAGKAGGHQVGEEIDENFVE